MLAYVFWHRPRADVEQAAYEDALGGFHRSLARSLPVGTCGTAAFRVAGLPWLAQAGARTSDASPVGYEDWYLLEDFAALGVLNEAAVGRGHSSAHDAAARRFAAGAGGLYALIEGEPRTALQAASPLVTWVARPAGSKRRALGELLGDGIEPERASLWRRQLVMGPAPEFCLIAGEASPGVSPTRLPSGWSAESFARVPVR